ncbi:hypothetical protein CRE_28201 [Caenorhabditis remanei]|uniref:Uncharacterized protein n=1 Tax=Caenorhabditis remanei TaxID=31234 RepID=E3LMU9_CAERE|nr:hypothetical protein CRE_28201 [Caenorhabditis remanei]
MYIHKPPPKKDSTTFGDVLMIFVFVIIPVSIALYFIIRHFRLYYQSFQFKPRMNSPKWPKWLTINTITSDRHDPEFEVAEFRVYRKEYVRQTWLDKSGKHKEKDKLLFLMMRKMLQDILGISVNQKTLPDSTCVISIPMRNFRSSCKPGEFIAVHGGPSPTSHYEFQMIGDDRIQATYYIVGGVEYGAGVCIYIEDPYQSIIHYRESVVKKVLSGNEYWSNQNIRNPSVEIVKRKNQNKQMLVTKSKYGEVKQWNFNGDQKRFEQIGPFNESSYEIEEGTNMKVHSKLFFVKMCHSKKEIVMIMVRNGIKMHAEWNQTTKQIHYSKCVSCNEPDDSPPPSYHSVRKP